MILPPYQPNPWQRGVQKLAALPLFSRLLSRTLHHIDPLVSRASDGKHTATTWMTGLPVVWLTTRGAKSGKLRTLPLVGIPDETGLILVASSFGKERHPGWYYNVRANPGVVLSFNGSKYHCQAREVGQPEYAILWSKAVSMYPGYAGYKERATGRQIPLFLLTQSDEAEPDLEPADII